MASAGKSAPPKRSTNNRAQVRLKIVELAPGDERLPSAVYPLLQALRPQLTREAFGDLVIEGTQQGLMVLAAWDGPNRCVGTALYRVLATSRGRVLFVDDLVTDPDTRSRGIGNALFAALEQRGRAARCERIELDSGVTNQAAHRFYYRQRMGAIALHFAKALTEAG